ncbi:hypothetical protein SAMN04488072_10536 [Lentibacillus halodurans]|uniref:Yip1 domain-containing protein n=1 Tax=Lentibacillus halodurans TaxID=237679 RepID=A0A1I0XFW7_9BACI|nr:zinc ribbon domain-containing protein [Lentibacillus halodurans]SFA99881.1 hypothetical protein SAMN04488072_10536 [Lentibacillus halodurans]
MLVCPECNNEQESGNFCSVCGAALESVDGDNNTDTSTAQENPVNTDGYQQTAAAETTEQSQQKANQTVENIKNGLINYWNYFLNLLKNPTTAFHTTGKQLLNAVITLLIFALASSLSLYFLANSTVVSWVSLPFFSLTFQLLFVAIVFLALAFSSILLMTKAAKNQDSAKTLLTQYGSLGVPFAAINVVAIVAGLAGSPFLTMVLLAASYGLFLYFIPVLFVYEKANLISETGHKVYVSLATSLIMSVLTFFVTGIILSDMMSNLEDMIRFSPF